jgi:transcriptional regulator with XRE-family HTH domain
MIVDIQLIGKRIEEARETRGLMRKELADQIKVAASTITRYEKGEIAKIKMPIIESIAHVLQVNPMWIIGKSDFKETKDMLSSWNNKDNNLTDKEERQIESDLEDMLHSMSSAAYEGENDFEDIEAFKATIKSAMIQAKKIAKKKYTPKKYKKD